MIKSKADIKYCSLPSIEIIIYIWISKLSYHYSNVFFHYVVRPDYKI